MLILALTMATVQAAPAPAPHAPACIGRPLDECLAALRAHMAIDETDLAESRQALAEST